VIVTDGQYLILSSIQPETIAGRIDGAAGKTVSTGSGDDPPDDSE
jgi:regulator of extracellular matrix RemA (YlzA/DUF370 family)